ncbi:MAG TPA: hypothetical protein VF145_00955, partial [Chitinophagaceae bacterium]
MAGWKEMLRRSADRLDDGFDQLVINFRKRMGSFRPLQIVPFRSYGTRDRLYIKGRVLEDRKIAAATDQDTIWNNLLNMYKRFESDEVPGAVLKTVIDGQELLVTTDSEGYFVLYIHPAEPVISGSLWYTMELELQHAPVP